MVWPAGLKVSTSSTRSMRYWAPSGLVAKPVTRTRISTSVPSGPAFFFVLRVAICSTELVAFPPTSVDSVWGTLTSPLKRMPEIFQTPPSFTSANAASSFSPLAAERVPAMRATLFVTERFRKVESAFSRSVGWAAIRAANCSCDISDR